MATQILGGDTVGYYIVNYQMQKGDTINSIKQAFEFGSLGYASALAVVLFLIIMVLTGLVLRSSTLWVYYEAERK